MTDVSLYIAPFGDKDIILTLRHEGVVFPEPGYITWPATLLGWAKALAEYMFHQEVHTHLYFNATPFVQIIRRNDGHTMRWSAVEYDADGTTRPYNHAFDVDLIAFAHQVYDALIMLQEWPQSRPYQHNVDSIYKLGAVLGLNDAPPPVDHPLRAHYLHMPESIQLVVNWETLTTDETVEADMSVMMHVVFDNGAKVFPSANWRGEAFALLDMMYELFAFWTNIDECLLVFDNDAIINLKRDDEARAYFAVFTWVTPSIELPSYMESEEIRAAQRKPHSQDLSPDFAIFYDFPNVDALDFTRQVIDAVRTLLRLLDERGHVSQHTLSARRMLPELEHIADLVQASTPPGNT